MMVLRMNVSERSSLYIPCPFPYRIFDISHRALVTVLCLRKFATLMEQYCSTPIFRKFRNSQDEQPALGWYVFFISQHSTSRPLQILGPWFNMRRRDLSKFRSRETWGRVAWSCCNWRGASAEVLRRPVSDFKAIRQFYSPLSEKITWENRGVTVCSQGYAIDCLQSLVDNLRQ